MLKLNKEVQWNNHSFKVVGRVEAHDSDMGYAGVVQLGTLDRFFALEPFTGEVILLMPLTELLRHGNRTNPTEYVVEISACDWGHPARCTDGIITVLIAEANVHWPRFEKVFNFSPLI